MMVAIVYYLSISLCIANNDIDPIIVLKGVKSLREQIPPSHLLIKIDAQNAITKNIFYLDIIFDKELRRFIYTNSNSSDRLIYNGSEVLHFYPPKYINIRALDGSFGGHLFDPRILGISALLSKVNTLDTQIPIKNNNSDIKYIGKEYLDNSQTYHISINVNDGTKIQYWVDVNNEFRVYKYRIDYNTFYRVVLSKYSNKYKWLPTYVEVYEYNNSGNVNWRSIIEILRAETNIKIPSRIWTIAGLEPPDGTEVTDLREQKLIGYWDGKRLIRYKENIPKQQPKVPRMLLIGVMVVVFLAPLIVIVAKKLRKTTRV